MRRMVGLLVVAVCMWVTVGLAEGAPSESATNAVDALTGEEWMSASLEEKQAFLFGIDTAVTIEYHINNQLLEKDQDKTRTSRRAQTEPNKPITLSPFERGWLTALKGMTNTTLIQTIDAWYTAHPEQKRRPVMSIIWYEIIEKKLSAEGASLGAPMRRAK